MSFQNLGLSPMLIKGLGLNNITKLFPIQEQVIPIVLEKKDVLGIAKTGSGKTASYVLPILQLQASRKRVKNRHVETLVMVPTRELAVQVQAVFQLFAQYTSAPLKAMAVFGGVSINPQMKALMGVDILVATPGRLLELVENKAIHLDQVKTLVLDEADKMLNLGFKEEMDKVLAMLPVVRQNLLFSATLDDKITAITQMVLNNPVVVKIEEEETTDELAQIRQVAYRVTEDNKGPLLRYLIRENPSSQILVFCSSTRKAENVGHKLRKNGVNAEAIHSEKSQGARTKALADFKAGNLKVLVATDLLARGVDISELSMVVNYELPRSPKDYVHRIGRTGRADHSGDAVSFITEEDQAHFRVIQKKMGKWVNMIESEELL